MMDENARDKDGNETVSQAIQSHRSAWVRRSYRTKCVTMIDSMLGGARRRIRSGRREGEGGAQGEGLETGGWVGPGRESGRREEGRATE
jgi:hypothetical protein